MNPAGPGLERPLENRGERASLLQGSAQQALCRKSLANACGLILLALPCQVHANPRGADRVVQNLPNLAAPDAAAPAHVELDQQILGYGYRSKEEKWTARIDDYRTPGLSLTLDYGMLLTEAFGVGASVNYQGDHAQALASGVLAPSRSLRLQLSAAELRDYAGCADATGCGASAHSRNSYLLGLKKYFGRSSLLSSLGFMTYGVTDLAYAAAGSGSGGEPASGRMQGYMLNMGLQPSMRSAVELRHGKSEFAYYARDNNPLLQDLAFGGMKYTLHLDNCMQLQGRYSRSAGLERLNVALAKDNWSIALGRAGGSNESGMSMQIGFSIPLGTEVRDSGTCSAAPEQPRPIAPLVDAATRHPGLLLQAPPGASGVAGTLDRFIGW